MGTRRGPIRTILKPCISFIVSLWELGAQRWPDSCLGPQEPPSSQAAQSGKIFVYWVLHIPLRLDFEQQNTRIHEVKNRKMVGGIWSAWCGFSMNLSSRSEPLLANLYFLHCYRTPECCTHYIFFLLYFLFYIISVPIFSFLRSLTLYLEFMMRDTYFHFPDARKDQGQEKRTSEDGMSGWNHWCNEHELWQTGRWWGTGRPGALQSMGSQRIRHDWATKQQCIIQQSIQQHITQQIIQEQQIIIWDDHI